MAQLADQLGRSFGQSTALPLSAAPVARVMRMPIGILMFDWRTRGGLVLHRLNRLVGPKSTLKSTICLAATAAAQRTCRHCKYPMVVNPSTGVIDCRCPAPRFWLSDETDYSWLPHDVAIALSYGQLPDGAVVKHVRGIGRVPVLRCTPPPGSRSSKAKDVPFVETFRNEPMRCLYLDSEHTIDEAWARANGVDTSLVLLVGARWAEQSLQTIEEAVLTREFDLVVVDSTSMLESKAELEKTFDERPKVASRATLMSRFVRRHLAAAFEDGLTARYSPTLLCTSQVTTKGIGSKGGRTWLDSTDGHAMNHAVSLDIRMAEDRYEIDEATQRAVYGDFTFQVRKNKAGGSPGANGTIRFWLIETPDHPVGDSDDLETVMRYARDPSIGLIDEGAGAARLTLRSPYVDDGALSFSRVGDCRTFLRDNPTVYADLRQRVLSALMERNASLEVTQEAPADA